MEASGDAVYALASSGWRPGMVRRRALRRGILHIAVHPSTRTAAAWIGSVEALVLWPDGWHVVVDDASRAVMVNSAGDVVARDGDEVRAGGGYSDIRTFADRLGTVHLTRVTTNRVWSVNELTAQV